MSIEFAPVAAVSSQRAAARPVGRVGTAVVVWLWAVAACIVLMVIVGGATRLTESGLSITEWEPLFGAVPPLTATDWDAKFAAYRQIPQYALHPDMTLGQFKAIFFWEWTHRLIGRALGLAIALPLAFFWAAGRLTPRLKAQALGLVGLVGLQGAVGWWMVRSGLTERTEVSQYRLATHLLLATATLGAVVWIAVGLRTRGARGPARRLRTGASLIVGLVLAQIGLGALVAGLRAGLVYNTWPAMDGRLIPPARSLLFQRPLWANPFENVTTVQFDHRMTAYTLVLVALGYAVFALRVAPGTAAARRGAAVAVLVLCQAAIGIATLLWAVPIGAALLHQVFAMALFTTAVAHRRSLAG